MRTIGRPASQPNTNHYILTFYLLSQEITVFTVLPITGHLQLISDNYTDILHRNDRCHHPIPPTPKILKIKFMKARITPSHSPKTFHTGADASEAILTSITAR